MAAFRQLKQEIEHWFPGRRLRTGDREKQTMNSNAFQEISGKVNIESVAQYLGLTVNRAKYIHCPLHGERTPSCKLYTEQGRFYCFGCGGHGDSVDLVSAVRGTSLAEAAAELNSYYSLNVDLDGRPAKRIKKKPNSLQVNEAEQVKRLVDAFADTAREARRAGISEEYITWFDEVHQAMLEDDEIRRSDPALFLKLYRKEFDRYADIRTKYKRIREAISRSTEYPAGEILEILGRSGAVQV